MFWATCTAYQKPGSPVVSVSDTWVVRQPALSLQTFGNGKNSMVCTCLTDIPRLVRTSLVSRYFVTDGSKFGADYLLYPGDPLLYHAQFTVRVLDQQAAIKPALLVGGARGSHSARKHLLLALVGSVQ